MGQAEKDLLKKWSEWLLTQGTGDAASDLTGAVVAQQNAGKNPWLLPGTWGQIGKPTRVLAGPNAVPDGTKLFIVAASSHATKDELPAGSKDDAALTKHAKYIHRLWRDTPEILIGGINDRLENLQSVTLVRETTDAFDVTINGNNPYTMVSRGTQSGSPVSGNQRMVTVGDVFLSEPVNPSTEPLQIIILGQSLLDDATGSRGELEYNVHLKYILR